MSGQKGCGCPSELIRPHRRKSVRNNKSWQHFWKMSQPQMYPHPENWPHLTVHLTPMFLIKLCLRAERSPNCHPIAQSLPVKMYGFAPEILCPTDLYGNFITTFIPSQTLPTEAIFEFLSPFLCLLPSSKRLCNKYVNTTQFFSIMDGRKTALREEHPRRLPFKLLESRPHWKAQ